MASTDKTPDWIMHVAAYLRANTPRSDDWSSPTSERAWDHAFSSAYQMACMALVALGEATEEVWGARPLEPPVRPKQLPLWDDLAVAVLNLAHQQGQPEWREPDGSPPVKRAGSYTIVQINPPPIAPPPPNIASAFGFNPARATSELLEVLAAMGLFANGTWTEAAEPVLWRSHSGVPSENDPRFAAALNQCIATLPPDVHAKLSDLSTITEADLKAEKERILAARRQLQGRFADQQASQDLPDLRLRQSVAFGRRDQADWIFYRRWRFSHGWLSQEDQTRALDIFHDPLAITMRRAVVARVFPDSGLALADRESRKR